MSRGPGHEALRKGRCSQPGGVYLITFTTARRRRVFADFGLACAACRTFQRSAAAEDAMLVGWVLMPDHFHGLVRLHRGATLSSCVQRIKSRSARACEGVGSPRPLWARAFHDHAARVEEDVKNLARYIVANPVRAGIVGRVNDYPFWNAVWI